jgi:hypothetical protein
MGSAAVPVLPTFARCEPKSSRTIAAIALD